MKDIGINVTNTDSTVMTAVVAATAVVHVVARCIDKPVCLGKVGELKSTRVGGNREQPPFVEWVSDNTS